MCAVLEEEALDELRDLGDLDMSGLNSSEPGVLKELVRNLFLFCYAVSYTHLTLPTIYSV